MKRAVSSKARATESEKNEQAYPPPPYEHVKNDQESLQAQYEEEKRKKRLKWILYISIFAVFQVIVILVFALVVMRVHRPKFRILNFEIHSLTSSQKPASFDMNFIAPIRVKNANFGPYKYDATTVNFTYEGVPVGQVAIPKSKANFKSTKKIDLNVTLSSASLPSTSNLGSDLDSGVLTLSSQGKMDGKVTLMFMFKKKKSSEMNCTIAIDVPHRSVQSLACI